MSTEETFVQHICPISVQFMLIFAVSRYVEQRRKHAEVLGRFEGDMEALASVEVPVQARTPDLARLSDLVPQQRMRDWAAQCASSHQHLSDKARPCLFFSFFPVGLSVWKTDNRSGGLITGLEDKTAGLEVVKQDMSYMVTHVSCCPQSYRV